MTDEERKKLVVYRIEKAKNPLNEIHLHIQNELWLTAMNRLYYACFYAVSALLLDKRIESKTHSGTKQMFGLHFIKTGIISEESGNFYTVIFNLRQTGDYDDFVDFSEEDVVKLIEPADRLISQIKNLVNKN